MLATWSFAVTTTDASLVSRCQNADLTAFNTLVSRYKDKIYRYVYRMTGSADDAEDLTQEVFVRMYTSINGFRRDASISTWLYRIAGNLCTDSFRKNKNARFDTSLDAPLESADGDNAAGREIADESNAPDTLFGRKELSEQIETALAKLPPKLRSAVILHDVEGLAYDEIAQTEGVPLGTIKSRIFNARAALRESLKNYLSA
ncbi:MAG: sigma-70 family RNA polymerase sigma factor [Armatimonadetes bacterium]|nr:sigma-70 family RNA polymerase sigma factor [Armatimonadota bacterium]